MRNTPLVQILGHFRAPESIHEVIFICFFILMATLPPPNSKNYSAYGLDYPTLNYSPSPGTGAYSSQNGNTVYTSNQTQYSPAQTYSVPANNPANPITGSGSSSGGGTNTQPDGFDSVKNTGTLNGKVYTDYNQWLAAGGKAPAAPAGNAQADALAAQARNDISSGFDAYFSQLDQMLGNIPGQQVGQQQVVDNNYNQGVSDVNAQKEASLGDLATSSRKNSEQQVKSLNDIADNIRSLFQAGNVMLGTRGAGDSSAANQYSYAVSKLGAKQRGDVLAQTRSIENDIADRSAKLNNIVTQETAKLKTNRDNAIIQVAQYFQDQTNQLLQAKANGQIQKGQSLASLSNQLLSFAQQQLLQADADYRNKQNSLMSWAESNSKTIGELKNNLAALGQYDVPGVSASQVSVAPQFDAQGNISTPTYFGSSPTNEKDKLFGF